MHEISVFQLPDASSIRPGGSNAGPPSPKARTPEDPSALGPGLDPFDVHRSRLPPRMLERPRVTGCSGRTEDLLRMEIVDPQNPPHLGFNPSSHALSSAG